MAVTLLTPGISSQYKNCRVRLLFCLSDQLVRNFILLALRLITSENLIHKPASQFSDIRDINTIHRKLFRLLSTLRLIKIFQLQNGIHSASNTFADQAFCLHCLRCTRPVTREKSLNLRPAEKSGFLILPERQYMFFILQQHDGLFHQFPKNTPFFHPVSFSSYCSFNALITAS